MSSIEFPIPEMTQGDDQQAMALLSNVISPGFIFKDPDGRYVMNVAGDLSDDLDHAERSARRRFHEVLGVLRAFKHGRGELQSELVRSPARGPSGAQVIRVGTVKVYMTTPGSLERFGESAYRAFLASSRFHEAVYLFGKPNRDAGDFYTIHELIGALDANTTWDMKWCYQSGGCAMTYVTPVCDGRVSRRRSDSPPPTGQLKQAAVCNAAPELDGTVC